MTKNNSGLENSLRCLQQPVTVSSIALLLLNDHVLKAISPSWLTGKLSDFAGVFFFPFVLAAGLSFVFGGCERSIRKIGMVAFGLTGLWFFLLKTSVLVNQASSAGASLLLGVPVKYALDPVDTLALLMLLPAWQLWSQPEGMAPKKRSWLILACGMLAALASSPVAPVVDVATTISYKNNVLYVMDRNTSHSASSNDLGETWNGNGPFFVDDATLGAQKTYPIQVCDPLEARTCYRTSGNGAVDASNDGGKSWGTGWSLPAGRLSAMRRIKGGNIDPGPYDLAIIQQDGQRFLFVAAGSEGLIKRQLPGGEWVRLGVAYGARPTPYLEPAFKKALVDSWTDYLLWASISLLGLSGASGWLWRKQRMKGGWYYPIVLVPLFWFLVAAVYVFSFGIAVFGSLVSRYFFQYPPYWLSAAVYLVPFAWGLGQIDQYARRIGATNAAAAALVALCAFSTIGILLSGIVPTVLLVQGAIAQDTQALLWTGATLLAIILAALVFFHRFERGILKEEDAGSS